jgi:dynein heavy chain
MMLKWPHI